MIKRILIILGLLLASLLVIGAGCKVETSTETSFGLTVEGSDFIKIEKDAEGRTKFVPRGSNVFKRGEKVNFVLLNVGKFKRGDDGLNWFDIDMEVKDPDGNVIISKQGMFGEGGHVDLPNDIAATPYAHFTTIATMKLGDYKIKLTIHDKIGGGSASKSKTFTLA